MFHLPGRPTAALLSTLLLAPLAAASPQAPAIDGDLSDWRDGATVWADADDLRIRLELPAKHSLQSAPVTSVLLLDLDADASSGIRKGPASGVDVSIVFSPPYRGDVGNGVEVLVEASDGAFSLKPSDIDLTFAPSHAASEFELRLDRAASMPWGEKKTFHNAGTVRWWLVTQDLSGNVVEVWDSGSGDVPAGSSETLADATLPESPAGAVRVASMNVLWGSPMISPPPFERMMNLIDADVWLFQEWDVRERDLPRIPAADIEAWLEERLAGDHDWTVITSDQRGVAIASRLPLEPIGPIEIKANTIGDRRAIIERSIRYVSAVVETAGGDLLLGNVHLKCCGGRGDEQDRQRIAESVAVSAAMHEALGRTGARGVVVGGDFNLVGSPIPLAIIKNGLDPTGVDLVESGAMVLGDDAQYTWTEVGSRFPAGRLDYLLASPSSLEFEGAWILDTARLSDEALSAMGLERSDSAATDHRPIVIDLTWND
jgi:endonuclease/exonuclease/phosphatase family metal-dependent hydrolase